MDRDWEEHILETPAEDMSAAGDASVPADGDAQPSAMDPAQREALEVQCRREQNEAIRREDWAAAEKWARQELLLLRQREKVPARTVAVLLRRLGQLSSRREAHTEALLWYRTLLHMHLKAFRQGQDMGNWPEDWGVYMVILERSGQRRPETLAAWAQRLEKVLSSGDPRAVRAWEDAAYAALQCGDAQGAVDALEHVQNADGSGAAAMRTCHALGVALARLGRREEAMDAFRRCIDAARTEGREDHSMVGDAMIRMAMALEGMGRMDEAAGMADRALARPGFESMHPQEKAIACNLAGRIYRRRGEHSRAVALYRQALREEDEGMASLRADILVGMAASLEALDKKENALEALEDAWRLEKDIHGEKSLPAANALRRLHLLLARMGRPEEADTWCRQEIVAREAVGDTGEVYVRALFDRAQYLERLGDAEAAAAYDAALAASEGGEKDPLAAMIILRQKALCQLQVQEDAPAAAATAEEALALAAERLDENDPHRIGLLETAALALEAADRPEEALDRLQQASVLRKAALGGHHIVHARTYHKMAALAQKTGDLQRARMDLLRELAELQNIRGYDREWAVTLRELGYLSIRGKALKQARSYFIQAAVLCERCSLTEDVLYIDVLRGMGRVDYVLGNHASSREALEKALILAREPGETRAAVLLELAETLDALDERDTALQYARQGLSLRQRIYPLHHMLVGAAWSTVGRITSNTPKLEDAIHAYRRAARCLDGMEEPPELLLADVYYNLAMIYRKQEKWAAAADEFRRTIEVYDRVSGMRERTAVSIMALVELMIIQGEYGAEPEELLDRAETFWRKDTDRWGHRMLEVYLLRGLMLRERGELDAAGDMFREALDFCHAEPEKYKDQVERMEGFLRDLEQRKRPPVKRARILQFPAKPPQDGEEE